jgi:uncharacterized protein YecT (DUF1311 family)
MHERLNWKPAKEMHRVVCLFSCIELIWKRVSKIIWSATMRVLAATLFLLTCLPSIVLADPATECGGGSQIEIGSCVADTLQRVDATVDIYLGFAVRSAAELDEVTGRTTAVPALEAAQAAWSTYRDEHCGYVGATFGGGSGTGIGINSCRVELGRSRAADLMRYAQ